MVLIDINVDKIKDGVINMYKVNLGIRKGERVLIVTDMPRDEEWIEMSSRELNDFLIRFFTAKLVYELGKENFPENIFEFFPYPNVGRHGAELSESVAMKLKSANVVVAITNYSLSHTKAREDASKAGVRIASMPTFLPEMFYKEGAMGVDYREVSKYSVLFAEAISNANKIELSSSNGTKLVFSTKGRVGVADTGILTEPGAFGNLPAGEAYIAPVEGTGNGVVVVEKGWFKDLNTEMVLRFKDGLVIEIEGGGDIGDKFRELLFGGEGSPYKERRNLAELGVGTNPNARRPDNILESEKIKGTCHVAIGDNAHFGGNVPADLHQDFVIPNATLVVDGKVLMTDGKWEV